MDIYGKVRKETKENPNFVPFRYQGQYYDNEVDFCYNRFRYYNCNTGSYISQDPIRLAGNNPTLYGYVTDPNTWIDVFGLSRKPVASRLPEGSRTGVFGPSNGVLVSRNPQTGDIIQIRTYDAGGNPVKDIDFGHDHGSGDPHVHDWQYPSEQAPNKMRSKGRSINDEEQQLIDKEKNKENGESQCHK